MKMQIYDYANRKHFVELPNKEIKSIFVLVLSGDETGEVEFTDGTSVGFDASNARLMDYNDGYYLVEGEDIQKWLNWKASEDSIVVSYDRQRAFSED